MRYRVLGKKLKDLAWSICRTLKTSMDWANFDGFESSQKMSLSVINSYK